LKKDERFQVYLTNTLDPKEPQGEMFLPSLTKETKEAHKVKKKPILVITGNPPYAGHSKNKSYTEIDAYKYTIEERPNPDDPEGKPIEMRVPLGERNPKWLNDDYVKFLRFAQMKMDEVDEGIVGVITNHSWLDNPTFRGMRQSLMRTFNQIYVLDLHGNFKKKERAPDGSEDENVFDIEQGVAISLFVRRKGLARGVWRGDLWGKRLEKYVAAAGGNLLATARNKIEPVAPHHIFIYQDTLRRTEYERGMPVTQIFKSNSVGIVTARDHLAIQFSKNSMRSTLREFAALSSERAREVFKLGKDAQDWKVEWARQDVRDTGVNEELIRQILYRPFDLRWTYYTGKASGFHVRPRTDIMKNMLSGDNVGLITSRLTKGETFQHAQVTSNISEVICMSPKTSNNGFLFPLYLQHDNESRTENFSVTFRAFIDAHYDNHHYEPEQLLGYIYAILHAPEYRSRYAEFLRIDFPRIPFTGTRAQFERLAELGEALVQAHLLRKVKWRGLGKYLGSKQGEDENRVVAVRYAEAEEAVYINDAQCFAPIPSEVWNFQIGGYQVLDKYLKSRKARVLSLDEQEHVPKVADVLAFTIEQMAVIDEAYKAAFPQQSSGPS
jgi:predicted helicase